jgi:hypothetical protein
VLPGDYAEYRDEPDALHAWAWRIVPPHGDLPCLSLRAGEPATAGRLPHSLDVLRFFLSGDATLPGADGGGWLRHA